jgi:hypothetical protein
LESLNGEYGGRRQAGAREPGALPLRLTYVFPKFGCRGPRGSSPAPRATHARGPIEVLLRSPMEAPLMWVWGMVAARCRPVAAHVRSAPSPRPCLFFNESDGGSAAEVMNLSEMMAAMPPRPKTSFTYAFYLFASVAYVWGNLDRVRVSGMFAYI